MKRPHQMELTPSQLSSLLDELVNRLRERDVKGHIGIVGGAAMALRSPRAQGMHK